MNKKLFLLSLLPAAVMAATVDFAAAKASALKNNDELKSKRLTVDIAKEQLDAAKAMNYGKVTLSENIMRTDNAMYVFGSKLGSREASFADFGFNNTAMGQIGLGNYAYQPKDLNYPKARNNYETAVTYEVPLFTGFMLTNAKEMAQLQIKANEIKLQRDEKLLAKEVLSAYNGAVAAKQFIAAVKKGKEATTAFVKMSNDFFDAGMVVKSDKLQAESYDAQVNAKMIEAENAYALALAYLRFLTGDMTISDVAGFENVAVDVTDPDGLQAKALGAREDLKWMDYNVKTMQKKVDFDSAARYPMVGFQAKYGYNDNQLTVSGDKDYYVLGLGVSYTLFDGGKISADSQKSRLEYYQTRHYQDAMTRGVALEVEKEYLNWKAKNAVIAEKLKSSGYADEIVASTLEMYKNGLAPMANLLLKEADAEKARAELIQARYDAAMAAASLKIALGENL